MTDFEGTALTAHDRDVLRHPLVGGVVLFSRNYESPAQITAVIDELHALRSPRLLIAVDHEGGRVQRFRSGFTELPAAATIGAGGPGGMNLHPTGVTAGNPELNTLWISALLMMVSVPMAVMTCAVMSGKCAKAVGWTKGCPCAAGVFWARQPL